MLVIILDGQGEPHQVAWQGQDQINDFSAALGAGNVGAAPQFLTIAPANALRAGWLFQNTSANAMLLNELGVVPAVVAQSWVINSGEAFPPPGYPIPTGAIQVAGAAASQQGDAFAYREWVNAPSE